QLGGDPTPLLRSTQSAHSNDFWANRMLASTLHERKQDLEAMRFVQAAMAISPGSALVHNDMGNCLRSLNRFDEAVDERLEAARLDARSAAIHGNLGIALYAVGRYSEAIEHFQLALRQWPDNVVLRLNLGQVLADLGRDSDAAEQFRQATVHDPDSEPARI